MTRFIELLLLRRHYSASSREDLAQSCVELPERESVAQPFGLGRNGTLPR
jgi:hypothetical protein